VPEITLANHMFRKTGFRRAVQVEFSLIGGLSGPGASNATSVQSKQRGKP
jgi:hypothetical protein